MIAESSSHGHTQNQSQHPSKDKGDDFESELLANAANFEQISRSVAEVLAEVLNDPSLEKFRLEYEKIHRALKKSHESEKRMVKKCRELNAEIVSNQSKIKAALRLSQEDQQTIASLQKEMDKTMKMMYAAQDKEQEANEGIATLKDEVAGLNKFIENTAMDDANNEKSMRDLKTHNNELQFQLNDHENKLLNSERAVQHYQKLNQELQSESDRLSNLVSDFSQQLEDRDKDLMKETRKKDKLQKEFDQLNAYVEESRKTIEKLQNDLKAQKTNATEFAHQLKESRGTTQKQQKDYEMLSIKATRLADDLEIQIQRNKEKRAECQNLESELKVALQQIGHLQLDKALWERKYEKEHRDVSHYKEMAEAAKVPLLVAQGQIDGLNNEIVALNKQQNELSRKYEAIQREKEKQFLATEKAEQRAKDHLDLIEENARMEKNLNYEIGELQTEIGNLRNTISQLERDRGKLTSEITVQRNNYLASEEEIKVRDVQVTDLNAKVLELENKMKHQLQLYESIRVEKNDQTKSLVETEEELMELRKTMKTLQYQVTQFKDEVHTKEQSISKWEFEYSKIEKVKESLQNELNRKNQLLVSDHNLVDQHEVEIKKLATIIKKMDDEMLLQKKEYDKLINERDIIGLQLIRRNDEIALLQERIRIQDAGLKAGEVQYFERLNEIQLLKAKIRDLNREYKLTQSSGLKLFEMKHKILRLERDLMQERTRVTALSEELENPMNVHRWRKLEGSDPTSYELIQKIQILQKKLILKTEEVVEKGLVIEEKEKQCHELKEQLSRQPGPEIHEQINTFQRNLRSKNTHMKVLAGEMNMYQAQANEYKYEVERLQMEVTELKRKYYQQKRRDDMLSNSLGDTNSSMPPIKLPNAPKSKFAGGGFAIK